MTLRVLALVAVMLGGCSGAGGGGGGGGGREGPLDTECVEREGTVSCSGPGEPEGEPEPADDDGGKPAGEDTGWRPVVAGEPAPPADPAMNDWDCPDGWIETVVGQGEVWEYVACDLPASVQCRGATSQVPGAEGCAPIGTECPPDGEQFHDEEAIRALAPGYDGPIVYVEPDRNRAGDGSRRFPLATVSEALDRRPEAGAIIAVAPGELSEFVHVDSRLAVVGMCASDTVIRLPVREDELSTLFLDSPTGARAANLTLRGRSSGLSSHGLNGVISMKSLFIDRPEGTGIVCAGGTVEIEDTVVRGTTATEGAVVAPGFGFVNTQKVTVRRSVSDHPGGSGLIAQATDDMAGSMDLLVEDFVAMGHTDGDALPMSLGIGVAGKVELRVRRALLEGYRVAGVSFGAEQRAPSPATGDIEDLVLRGHDRRVQYNDSAGIGIREGSTVTLRRVRIDDGPSQGISVGRAEDNFPERHSKLTAEDLLLRRGGHGYRVPLTHGIVTNLQTTMALARVVIQDQQGFGFFMTGPLNGDTAAARVDDMVIEGTVSMEDEPSSCGLGVGMASSFDGKRIRLIGNDNFGFLGLSVAERPDPKIRVQDLYVDDVTASHSDEGGAAIAVANGADVAITRAYVGDDVHFGAYFVNEHGDTRSNVQLTDLEIDGSNSVGMQSFGDIAVTLNRVAIRRAGLWAVGASGELTPDAAPYLTGNDLLIEGTNDSNKGRWGTAILMTNRAIADLGRVTLRDNLESAVLIERESRLSLREATISRTGFPDCQRLPITNTYACTDEEGAITAGAGGVAALRSAVISLENFVIEENAGVGLYVSADSTVTAHNGRIRANAIGLDLDGATPSPEALSDVRLEDNRRDASRSSMRPPDPNEAITRVEF